MRRGSERGGCRGGGKAGGRGSFALFGFGAAFAHSSLLVLVEQRRRRDEGIGGCRRGKGDFLVHITLEGEREEGRDRSMS